MSFESQPTLHGELLTLRPLCADDYDGLYGVASDPLMWEQHPAFDRYQQTVFRELFDQSLQSGGALVAIDNKTEAVIGSSRYLSYDPQASEVEIGFTFLARPYWGGAYNGEMKRLMIQHAFQFVDAVVLLVGPDNVRSRKAVEKIGAAQEGTRVDATGHSSLLYRVRSNR